MDIRINEHDEFLLSELLDGDLSPDEAAGLRLRMEQEPALQEAYDSLARVNAALETRRADQPAVDWDKFYRDVMNAVEGESVASRSTIRLGRWIRLGVPLAAAAAIVLLVSIYPFGPETSRTGSAPGTMLVRVRQPTPVDQADPGSLEIAFARPTWPDPNQATPGEVIQVTFLQSVVLQEAIEKDDETARSRSGVVIAGGASSLPDGLIDELMGGPPL